ncbi:aspartate kinase [Alishewanella tabrizica]|uniref:homoserine dehydrogenase n=1 Tax=Alishewanella tabrizica TaxID=671278 RepID=A0ABQ2WE87_9ALTE|nr:aspartate kinase [Alishewanella tabrizica]GGW52098.1 hypothetical protein GCM10008111_05080 [Alishewanella tabrizica]
MTATLATPLFEAESYPRLSVIVAGTGNVGIEFLRLFRRQQQRLAGQLDLQLAGVFNSRKALLNSSLDSDTCPNVLAQSPEYELAELITYLQQLPAPKVLVDITPSQEFARLYPVFVAAGCHLISANKQGVTLPVSEYQAIQTALQQRDLHWYSNTTCGAGIPVQRVLQELRESGDQIRRVSGVFSGTLSWLLCRYDGSKPFSEFVLDAKALGYTEPDPRDDLSGKDVQRKLLVLARELQLPLELADIALTPLLPAGLEQGEWSEFWQHRVQLDQSMDAYFQAAQSANKVLRYAASLTLKEGTVIAEVKLVAVLPQDPLAALAPCENMFVIESDWYKDSPLVLKGPGAGREVTAGGLHADLAVLAKAIMAAF